jgi:transposase
MMTKESLRVALAKADRSGAGRPYPPELRREAVAYVESRRQEGATRDEAASEIGVSTESIARWSARMVSGERVGFRQVVVMPHALVATGPAAKHGRPIVHGPHGLRIEGLDVAGIAELLRSLV